jgi:AAA domain
MPKLSSADVDRIRLLPTPAPAGGDVGTMWAPVDLQAILAGTYTQPAPTRLERTDGRCLLYPGRVHALNAEPEAGKTWLALKACDERLLNHETVLYIDFEDSAPSIVSRLRSLGADPDTIAEHFIYLRPDEGLSADARADFERVLDRMPALVVIDGLTEAYVRLGLNPESNQCCSRLGRRRSSGSVKHARSPVLGPGRQEQPLRV